jgi:hypothetical protein
VAKQKMFHSPFGARQPVKLGFDLFVNVAQANNQWNIGADLGNDPMESAFARTLTAGIKGVAMVLDQEVQPLTSDSTKCWACQEVPGFSCNVLVILALFCNSSHFPLKKKETSVLRSLVSIRISAVQPGALGVGFCHQRWCNR